MYNVFWIVAIFSLVVGGIVSASVNRKMNKYSNVSVSTGLTGREMALKMLNDNGVYDVSVEAGAEGQDHFDPRSNTIRLSPSNFNRPTLTAAATACHEAGHALQYARNYTPLRVRSSMVPVVNLASNVWPIFFILGIVLQMLNMAYAAIAVYGIVVLFQVVTLPVEFDASRRGLKYMNQIGISGAELTKSKSLLTSCAMTYVVAALASLLQIVLLVAQLNRE